MHKHIHTNTCTHPYRHCFLMNKYQKICTHSLYMRPLTCAHAAEKAQKGTYQSQASLLRLQKSWSFAPGANKQLVPLRAGAHNIGKKQHHTRAPTHEPLDHTSAHTHEFDNRMHARTCGHTARTCTLIRMHIRIYA